DGYQGGDAVEVSVGITHSCARTASGDVTCWGRQDLGSMMAYDGGDATQVVATRWITCVLKTDATVHCGGRNNAGQAQDYPGPLEAEDFLANRF
ncbi:MAG: hypothetical protein ACPGQL_11355, partial [Thermoplasmatota archaeon]